MVPLGHLSATACMVPVSSATTGSLGAEPPQKKTRVEVEAAEVCLRKSTGSAKAVQLGICRIVCTVGVIKKNTFNILIVFTFLQ